MMPFIFPNSTRCATSCNDQSGGAGEKIIFFSRCCPHVFPTAMTKTFCSICILAGGRSRRMGREKAGLRLGSKTLIGRIRTEARKLGLPVRIIRRDLVPRCGPLGGILTALKTSQAEAELFLACDMPFISAELLEDLLDCWKADQRPVFMVFGDL